MKVGDGTSGFDIFSLHQSATDPGKYIALLTQCRHTLTGDVQITSDQLTNALSESKQCFSYALADLKRWGKKTSKYNFDIAILENCEFILVAVSTRTTNILPAKTPESCLLVCASNLNTYFGPFASRVTSLYS